MNTRTPAIESARNAAAPRFDMPVPQPQWQPPVASHDEPEVDFMPAKGAGVVRFAGPDRRWSMPVALCSAPEGYDTSVDAPQRPFHAIEWHLSTSRVLRVLPSGQTVEALDPTGFVIHPARSRLSLVASAPAQFVHFCFGDAFLRTVAADWAGAHADRSGLLACDRVMRSDSLIVPMLDAYFRRAFDEAEAPSRLEMDSRASLILLEILRRHSALAQPARRSRGGGLAPYQLKRVCDAMTADLAEEVPLAALASMVGVSYHHFCHAFKASVGLAPHQWLVERRVERACELLRTTRESVTEIAAAVGYDDPNQLLRVFRSRRGTTPAGYRREFLAQALPTLAQAA